MIGNAVLVSALAYIALSPHAKDMAENMYRALWSSLFGNTRARMCEVTLVPSGSRLRPYLEIRSYPPVVVIGDYAEFVEPIGQKPKPIEELTGLVYGCTKMPDEGHLPLMNRPVFWGGILGSGIFLLLQWIFW